VSAVGQRGNSPEQPPMDDELSTMTFEQAVSELEEIVRKLEEGKSSLEEALRLFERGVKLAKFCEHKLEWVERRLQMVIRTPNGRIELRDFDVSEENAQEGASRMTSDEMSGAPSTDEGLPF